VATGVYASYADHPLGALRAAGVRVTLASDDPPYFGATIGGEYAVAHQHFGFDEGALADVTRLAVEASFAERAAKASILDHLTIQGDRPTI
jgi:adenosine deaminase